MQYWLISVVVFLFSCCASLAFADGSAADKNSMDTNLYDKFFADKPERFEKTCKGLFKRLHHLENATAADGSSLSLEALQNKLTQTVEKEPKLVGIQLNWQSADVDGNGLLTKEEFCNGLRSLMQERKVSDFVTDGLTEEQTSKMKQFACQYVDKIPGVNLHELCDKKTADVATLEKRGLDKTSKNLAIATVSMFFGAIILSILAGALAAVLPAFLILAILAGLAKISAWVLLIVFLVRIIAKSD